MNELFKKERPWRNALIATTGLSIFFMVATLLWTSGNPEWAFLLGFLAILTAVVHSKETC